MSYRGKKKSSYGNNRKQAKGFYKDKRKKTRPITESLIEKAPKMEQIIPSNKKLNVTPKNTQNEEYKPDEDKASCLERSRKTEWKVDLLRKDPIITKKEEEKIKPLPNSVIEEKGKSGSINLWNPLVTAGCSLTTSNTRKMNFPEEKIKKHSEENIEKSKKQRAYAKGIDYV